MKLHMIAVALLSCGCAYHGPAGPTQIPVEAHQVAVDSTPAVQPLPLLTASMSGYTLCRPDRGDFCGGGFNQALPANYPIRLELTLLQSRAYPTPAVTVMYDWDDGTRTTTSSLTVDHRYYTYPRQGWRNITAHVQAADGRTADAAVQVLLGAF
ncbi:MAG: hypothetical protein ABIH03_10790 [Pseudomonadota bacterium]